MTFEPVQSAPIPEDKQAQVDAILKKIQEDVERSIDSMFIGKQAATDNTLAVYTAELNKNPEWCRQAAEFQLGVPVKSAVAIPDHLEGGHLHITFQIELDTEREGVDFDQEMVELPAPPPEREPENVIDLTDPASWKDEMSYRAFMAGRAKGIEMGPYVPEEPDPED